MNNTNVIVFVVGGCALAACLLAWHFSRARSLLERWAKENGYEIVDRRYRHLLKGPFFWTSSRGQAVYHVTVRDRQGHTRSGWLRCGSWWGGMFSDKTEVRWEPDR